MEHSNSSYKIGLKIHFLSFSLPKNIIKDKDEIRISVTTIPENNNQHFTIQKKQLDYTDHALFVNVTNFTKKIIVVFRKKSFILKDPIIASTIINSCDFPKHSQDFNQQGFDNCTDIKIMNIYEPFQQKRKQKQNNHSDFFEDQYQYAESQNNKQNRLIIGEMQVQLSFTTIVTDEIPLDSQKKHNKRHQEKSLENNEQTMQNKMFQDLMKFRL